MPYEKIIKDNAAAPAVAFLKNDIVGVETTPEWYMAQADQMLQSGQIDPATHQALLMYMQLYFKMGS